MSAPPEKLAALRHLLADRFPAAPRVPGRTLATGLPAFDEVNGGLPLGAITEFVCAAPSCGGHLLLGQLLATTRAGCQRVALIDAGDSFDPASHGADFLTHLIWVRGSPATVPAPGISTTATALQAADLLARDANLGLVVLDLQHVAETELRHIPASFWYRLQRAVETTDLALVILTFRATVPSAQVRFLLHSSHAATALDADRLALAAALAPILHRQRRLAATAVA